MVLVTAMYLQTIPGLLISLENACVVAIMQKNCSLLPGATFLLYGGDDDVVVVVASNVACVQGG